MSGNGEKRKRILLIVILLFAGGVFALNRDLFHFSYSYPFTRTFSPEEEPKGTYILTDEFTLKPADYHLRIDGELSGSGNGFFLVNAAEEEYLGSELDGDVMQSGRDFSVRSMEKLRFGVRYDPGTRLTINGVTISSDHVLYRESLTRHLVQTAVLGLVFIYICLRLIRGGMFGLLPEKLAAAEKTALILFGLALIASFPCLIPGKYVYGDDLDFHLSRIEGIASGLKYGYFPVRIYLSWLENYGVGCGFYYPDFFLYLPALMRIAGFSILGSWHTLVILVTFCSLLSVWLTVRRFCEGREWGAYLAACLCAFSAYRLICVNYRSALGEVQSFIFFPLIFLGIYELFHGHPERWWIFALGFWGLAASHMISLAIAGVFTAVCFLIRLRGIISDRRILAGIVKAAAVTVLLTASFWLPMLEQTLKNDLYISSFLLDQDTSFGTVRFIRFGDIFTFFSPWMINPYPGWPLLAVILFRLILFIRYPRKRLKTDMILIFSCLGLFMCTALFPWQPFAWFLKRIQVSWRLMAPVSAGLAVCGGEVFAELAQNKRRSVLLPAAVCFCLICSAPLYHEFLTRHMADDNGQILADKEVQATEYLPDGLTVQYVHKNKDLVRTDSPQADVTAQKRRGLDFRLDFTASDDNEAFFSLPLIYHYGYRAELSDADGKTEPAEVRKDEMGLVRIGSGKLAEGRIHAFYRKTPIQYAGEIITALSAAGIIIIMLKKKQRDGEYAVG